jgi:hypothetical protein
VKRRMLSTMLVCRPCILTPVLLLSACGLAATSGGFDSPNPAAKMYAIEYAARNGDRSAIPRIIEQLDSDDPAVRSLAISSLYRLTGQTYGYRDYDPPRQRREAIGRWVEAELNGELNQRAGASDDSSGFPAPEEGAHPQKPGGEDA